MSDVDAIRCMASEHDLEFVDLDTYGVDPAAGKILPLELARRHHMVAIKQRFGTPVIATSDPDDLYAQDSVRASIGRDFISVVASRDQIADYLDRLFDPDVEVARPEAKERGSKRKKAAAEAAEREAADERELANEIDSYAPFEVDSPFSENAGKGPERVNGAEATSKSNGPSGRDTDDQGESETTPVGMNDSSDARAGQDFMARSPGAGHVNTVDEADPGLVNGSSVEASASTSSEDAVTVFGPGNDQAAESSKDPSESTKILDNLGTESGTLEPATSLLPAFASQPPEGLVTSGDPAYVSADELAELALSVQGSELQDGPDSTALAADLVAEAVATYQEKHGDDQQFDGATIEVASETAMFPPLAKALVDGGRVSLDDMRAVLEEFEETGKSIARILTAQNLVTEADLMWGMAEEMGLEFVDLDTIGLDFAEAGTIPEATARHHNVIVIRNDNGTPVVAASNPTDVFAMDDLRTIMGRNFVVVVATRTQISAYIGRVFNSGGDAADMAMEASLGIDGASSDAGVDDIQAVTEEAPIVRYVNLLILQALNERASDIHIEPTGTDLRIRYRIDGVLHDVSTAPRSIAAAVTTRLKVMADMNIAEHRIPQDGRISLNVGSKGIDLRMATLPTIHGEKVVMRVLDKSSVVLGFGDLGFDEDLLATYEGIFTKPYGTILVTGPTGSGKSTTLYTTLTALNSPEKNIITVEDPVELPLKGINQVQLNLKAGLNFAAALRAILRSDPDIVLIGEIRDKETAVIAIEAALTGHMVLSTLHTNNAASTPMRLIEMGLEPFLVTSSLSGVLAQRLARRLCIHCKEAYEPTEADIVAAGWTAEEVEAVGGMSKVFRAVGCSACSNTGYRGRKALAELLPMSEEIERMIIEGGSVEDIHRLGVTQGMVTLRQSGLRKAVEGETTLEEVLRVVA
jgi:type IV pilus assembly protein PilB